ncbi:Protein of unknown function, partial [Gryllus bimaculatus]
WPSGAAIAFVFAFSSVAASRAAKRLLGESSDVRVGVDGVETGGPAGGEESATTRDGVVRDLAKFPLCAGLRVPVSENGVWSR